MKHFFSLLSSSGMVGLFLLAAASTVHAQTGIGNRNPDASSMLDITSANKGLLIPRVALTGTADGTTIANPANALLVYNTSNFLAGPGFYYNAGSGANPNWQRFVSSSAAVGLEFWRTTGNSNTNPGSNYIGTNDAQDLVFKVNSRERFRIRKDGSSNGTSLLSSDFEVNGKTTLAGDVKVTGNNSVTTLRNTNIGLESDKATFSVYGEAVINGATANGNGTPGAGSLTVSGATTLNNALTVAGPSKFSSLGGGSGSRLVVADNLGNLTTQAIPATIDAILNQTATAQGASFRINGSGQVGTTLNVGGATTLGTLSAGATTLSSTLTVTGAPRFSFLGGGTGNRLVIADGAGNLATQAIPSPGDAIQNQNSSDQPANFRISGSGQVGGSMGVGTSLLVGTTLGVAGASTLSSLGVTNNASVGGSLTVAGTAALNGGATLSSAVVTNALTAGTLATSGLATLASAKVTNLSGGGNRAVVAAADGTLATAAVPGSSGEFIRNSGTAAMPAFDLAGSGRIGTTLSVGGATTLANLTAETSTLSSATVTGALSAGTVSVSGTTTLAGLNAGTTTLSGLTTGAATLGSAQVSSLGGSGVRLVVAESDGTLGTQAIPVQIEAIHNQNAEDQSANFRINGSGRVGSLTVNSTATISGNATVAGTLGVTGNAFLSSLSASGLATLQSARVTSLNVAGMVVNDANGNLTTQAMPDPNLAILNQSGPEQVANFRINGLGQLGGLAVNNNATISGSLGVSGNSALTGKVGIGAAVGSNFLTVGGNVVPSADDAHTLGTEELKWKTVYAINGTVQTSDARLKTNVTALGYGLNTVMAMRPVRYAWKKTPAQTNKIGFLAQELQQVVPEVVSVGTDDSRTLGVNYAELVPVLVKALQEQQAQLDTMRGRAETAEAAVQSFESRLRALEAGSSVHATAQGQR